MPDSRIDELHATLSRRVFLRTTALGAAGLATGCLSGPTEGAVTGGDARLRSRPGVVASPSLESGTHLLNADIDAEATLFVPESFVPDRPSKLFIMMHGAGASRNGLDGIFPVAEPYQLLVLLPKSRGRTWDLILGGFSYDVAAIDRALGWIFQRATIDPAGITLAGFSDGGSYALSLGLSNGDLFSKLAAFSPGFMAPGERVGTPEIFLVHGTQDTILPISGTSRVIAEQLRAWHYTLDYREFDGPHTIRYEDMKRAFDWIAG